MVYGYLRVSSRGQKDNNSFEDQTKSILEKYPDAVLFREQFTGKTTNRPKLNKVMEKMQCGDTLVVTKLDRLARTVQEGIDLIQTLFDRGASVHVLNIGLLENTSMGKFFITTLFAVAELERSMILERMESGKAIARLDPNYREGRPAQYSEAQKRLAVELLKDHTCRQVSEMTGMSERTIHRAKAALNDTHK